MSRYLIAASLALSAVLTLPGCMLPTAGGPQTVSGTAETTAAEQDLQQRTLAYQRTLVEATASGAVLGGFVGGRAGGAPAGALYGAGVGLFAGSYVAFLQQQYSDRESQLETLRTDLQVVNADLAATINTMRAVVADQRQSLAQVAANPGVAGSPAQEAADSQANLANMQRIIQGASEWQTQFVEARSLAQTPAEQSRIDPELARLSQRIDEMRQIAASLAA